MIQQDASRLASNGRLLDELLEPLLSGKPFDVRRVGLASPRFSGAGRQLQPNLARSTPFAARSSSRSA